MRLHVSLAVGEHGLFRGRGEQCPGGPGRHRLSTPARPASPGNPQDISPLTRLCQVNAAFYREQPSQRHVHRFGGARAAVLTGLV